MTNIMECTAFLLLVLLTTGSTSSSAAFCFGRKFHAEPPPLNKKKIVEYVAERCRHMIGKELEYYGFYHGYCDTADNDIHTFLYI